MKLEVGMYVRTPKGIAKIIGFKERKDFDNEFLLDKEIIDTHEDYYTCCMYDYKFYLDQIIKASHNIIDLIQSKDLIVDTKNNLYVVDRVEGDYVFTTSKNEYGLIITLVDYQIKSIVTKEQFESIKYSLEG